MIIHTDKNGKITSITDKNGNKQKKLSKEEFIKKLKEVNTIYDNPDFKKLADNIKKQQDITSKLYPELNNPDFKKLADDIKKQQDIASTSIFYSMLDEESKKKILRSK